MNEYDKIHKMITATASAVNKPWIFRIYGCVILALVVSVSIVIFSKIQLR